MVKFFLVWLVLGVAITGCTLTLDQATIATSTTPPMNLHAAEQFKFVLFLGAGFLVLVPAWVLVRLGVAAILIRFGARQWYAGRDQHYEEN
jgi:hypothetical protein